MVKITWWHPLDRVSVTAMRTGSRSAELYLHMSARDIKRLSQVGKSKQVKAGRGLAFRWSGPFTLLATGIKKKPKPKPKPAPPIPRVGLLIARDPRKTMPKKKSTKKRKLSAYNLFVQTHRLAGKDMKEIGRLWRKKKK